MTNKPILIWQLGDKIKGVYPDEENINNFYKFLNNKKSKLNSFKNIVVSCLMEPKVLMFGLENSIEKQKYISGIRTIKIKNFNKNTLSKLIKTLKQKNYKV